MPCVLDACSPPRRSTTSAAPTTCDRTCFRRGSLRRAHEATDAALPSQRHDRTVARPPPRGCVVSLRTLQARLDTDIGDRLAVVREIARGGMAAVYLAHDGKPDREVAVTRLDQK